MVKVPDTASPFFEYAPAPESRSVVDIKASYGLFIDGAFVDACLYSLLRREWEAPDHSA